MNQSHKKEVTKRKIQSNLIENGFYCMNYKLKFLILFNDYARQYAVLCSCFQ